MTPCDDEDGTRYAVTLTLNVERMHRKSRSGALTGEEAVDFAKATFAAFRWKLDRIILKSAATKHGRELTYVPVIEGQGLAAHPLPLRNRHSKLGQVTGHEDCREARMVTHRLRCAADRRAAHARRRMAAVHLERGLDTQARSCRH